MLSDGGARAGRTFWKVHSEKQNTYFKRRGTALGQSRRCSKKHWHKGLPGIDGLPTGANGRILRMRGEVTEWRGGERGSE